MRGPLRVAPVVAATLGVAAIALTIAGLVFGAPLATTTPMEQFHTVWLLVFPMVGAFLAWKRPRNAIGWILAVSGLALIIENAGIAYAEYGLVHAPGAVPVAAEVGVVADAFWMPGMLLAFTYLFLLAPDGHLPSRRWRVVAWSAGVALALSVPVTVLIPGEIYAVEGYDNPLGWQGAGAVLEAVQVAIGAVTLVSALLAGIAFILRYRRSTGDARLQLRALAFAASVLIALLLFLPVYVAVLQETLVAEILYDVMIVLPAVGVAIGVLRYRLYDLDRIISRTIGYVLVTAVLAAAYAAVVLGFQTVVGPADAPDVVVATATLLVAALFRPVRTRVQQAVDRRFNRSRYDAARVVEEFSSRLRDEVDLATLQQELVAVVGRTVAPESASLLLVDDQAR